MATPATLTNRLLVGLTIAGAALVAASVPGCEPAHANPLCGPLKVMLESMEKEFREKPVSVGFYSNGDVLVILASKDGSTWTQLRVGKSGNACAMASGTAWEPGTLAGKGLPT